MNKHAVIIGSGQCFLPEPNAPYPVFTINSNHLRYPESQRDLLHKYNFNIKPDSNFFSKSNHVNANVKTRPGRYVHGYNSIVALISLLHVDFGYNVFYCSGCHFTTPNSEYATEWNEEVPFVLLSYRNLLKEYKIKIIDITLNKAI